MRKKIIVLMTLFVFSLQCFASNLTLGLVKSQIKIGISQAEVIGTLGSPNMVTNDREGNEVWTYDKISSTTTVDGGSESESDIDTKSEGNSFNLGIPFLAGFGVNDETKKTKSKTKNDYKSNVTVSKKTLTVIIKFDKKSLVSKVRTHMSKF